MSIIDEVLKVMESGYQPYSGKISSAVANKLGCEKWEQCSWFVKTAAGKRLFVCLGCEKRPCALSNPNGFEQTAPARTMASNVAFAETRAITPEDLLRSKKWFRVNEAAFILNVSERHIRKLVDEGVLVRHINTPVRVTRESLQEEFSKEDW